MLKNVESWSINGLFIPFWAHHAFSVIIKNHHFYPIFNTCLYVQFQINLMNRFREMLTHVDIWSINNLFIPFWAQHEFSLIIRNHLFYLIFNSCHRVQFQINLIDRFREMLKNVDYWSINDLFILFWAHQEFSPIMENHLFYPLFNACHKVQFQDNLMNRFRGNVKNVDFAPKTRMRGEENKNFP